MSSTSPVTVAAVNDYDLVVEGLAALLGRYADKVVVGDEVILGEPVRNPVDVALYDTYGRAGLVQPALRELVAQPGVGRVAVFSLDLRPAILEEARTAGACGIISKALPGAAIVDAVLRIAHGEEVEATSRHSGVVEPMLDWPGRVDGLTERESEVLVLCAEGHTNREIADALCIGTETVKTHLSNAYRRLGLRNRTQAARYVESTPGFRRHPGLGAPTEPWPPRPERTM